MSAPNRSALAPAPPLWADGALLLDALPIAAAIVEFAGGEVRISANNSLFADAVATSTVGSLSALADQCLAGEGLIARHLQAWFTDSETANPDLDFRDGSGVAAHYYRLKLAPLPTHGEVR